MSVRISVKWIFYRHPFLKSVALTVLELLVFYAKKIRGSRDDGHAAFLKNFNRSCPETHMSNLKSVALTFLEPIAFKVQKFGDHMTLAMPPFGKFLKGHVWTVHGNMHAKFEVRSFNCFKLVWLTGPLCTDTQTQADIERKQYLRHSLPSLPSVFHLGKPPTQCLDEWRSVKARPESSIPWCHPGSDIII